MGTVASLHVQGEVTPALVDEAAGAAFAELDRLEAVFSTFRPASAVSRINRGELHPLDAGDEVLEVLDACTWLEHASGGAFRSRRPGDGSLDPAGFVKGWAAERAAQHLAGLAHWYLSLGGDLVAHGTQADGSPWRVAVADPLHPNEIVAAVDVVDAAVATSGTAERGTHVWDGRTMAPAAGLASMTVVGPSLAWADAFATAAFAMGAAGLSWLAGLADHHGLAVTTDGRVLTTPGWA
jgi:thiamine biosynthesis lipoprotein